MEESAECACGHIERRHFSGICAVQGCDCTRFTEAPAPELEALLTEADAVRAHGWGVRL